MPQDFPESDWKRLRDLRSIALERFCERVLDEIKRASMDASKSSHERYLAVYRLVAQRDKELGRAFDDPRRSRAIFQLAEMYLLGLIQEGELSLFTPSTRDAIASLTKAR